MAVVEYCALPFSHPILGILLVTLMSCKKSTDDPIKVVNGLGACMSITLQSERATKDTVEKYLESCNRFDFPREGQGLGN